MTRAAAIHALRPFAALADALKGAPWALARKEQTLLAIGDAAITTNDVRAARATLAALEGPSAQAEPAPQTASPATSPARKTPARKAKAKATRKRSKKT